MMDDPVRGSNPAQTFAMRALRFLLGVHIALALLVQPACKSDDDDDSAPAMMDDPVEAPEDPPPDDPPPPPPED